MSSRVCLLLVAGLAILAACDSAPPPATPLPTPAAFLLQPRPAPVITLTAHAAQTDTARIYATLTAWPTP